MSRVWRRAVAAATVVLVLLAPAVLALRAIGPGVAGIVPPSPSLADTPGPTLSPAATATPDSAQVYATIESQVRALRGLPAPALAPPTVITRAQLMAELRRRFDHDYPPARRAADNVMFRALGLLTAGQDVGELQLRLLSGQVIGFYDDETKRMTLVSDSGIGPEVKVTYAHEYTHALQDHAFRLASLQLNAAGEDDRDLARLSLVEGDATVLMFQWALDHLTQQELSALGQVAQPDMTGIPGWMINELQFPYTAGQQFVSRLEASGGLAALDAAFRAPPASSEQILHEEKFRRHEGPLKVAAPALAGALGSGWRAIPADTLGEAMIGYWLQALGVGGSTALKAAAGWGGDRLVAASGSDGSLAVAWRLAWDTATDATQFTAAYRLAATRLKLSGRVVSLPDQVTLVVQGSSAAIVDRVVAGLR
jgi:hypothetical protein